MDGNQIIVEQCPVAENGEIAVALIGDSNGSMSPILSNVEVFRTGIH